MAKKATPKPFFSVRGDFEESLANFTQCALNLYQVADTVIEIIPDLKGGTILREALAKMRAAMMSDDDE